MPQPTQITERDDAPDRSGVLEVDAIVAEDISALIEAGQRGMVLNLVADLHPADLALLLNHLLFDESRRLFAWLPAEQGSETLTELDDDFRAALLKDLRTRRLTGLLDELDTDDAADVLADLPDEVARRVLPDLEAAADLTELLGYDEETAGGIMAREYVAAQPDWSIAEATEAVRAGARDIDDVYAVFATDTEGRLEGVLSLKRLLLSPADARVRDIMDLDFHSVSTGMDQEEVARIMERYDLVTLPVLDPLGRMVGRVTIDDVVDVIRSEAEEDIQLMSGVSGDESLRMSVFRASRGRLPWLMIGLTLSAVSGTVIKFFEGALEQAIVLAMFIPIVMAMGGNAAVQSAAITVQGLSSGELWSGDAFRRLGKEVGVALFNGVVIAALLCAAVFAFGLGDVTHLATTLGLTILAVIVLATSNGALIPFALERLGLDPASAMGPFVTTLNDIIGLTVYFLIASMLYL